MRRELPASISIVVPCYRSASWIDQLVERIDRATRELKGRRELILVDDASPDDVTWPALRAAATRHDWVHAVGLQFNVGQFRATLAGMARARGEWVVTLDDDLQTPPEEIPKLVLAAAEHPEMDAIIGAYANKQHSLLRNAGTGFVSWLYRKLFGQQRGFQTTSFRILRQNLVRVLCAHETRRPQIGALILQSTTPGRRMNVEVEHRPRPAGESGYSWGTLVNLALDNVFHASAAPLRAVSMLGVMVAAGSFVLSIFYFFRWFFGYIEQPGFTTLVLLLTFVAGMLLLSIGLVGEYVQRVVAEVTGQPHHVVREEVAGARLDADAGAPAEIRTRSRLLVLGAGVLQVPLVKTAVEMGLEVVTADNVPTNPAHAWAHHNLDVSTRDPALLTERARELGVEAVVTAASDIAVPGAAKVIHALGLPGSPGAAADEWTDKEAFRAFQTRSGLRHPDGVAGSEGEALAGAVRRDLPGRVVVKPVDRSGSLGIRVLESTSGELPAAIGEALEVSFVGRARVEAYVEGHELGGAGVVLGGRLVRFFATAKRVEGPAVRGHVYPADLPPELEARIHGELQAHVSAIGLESAVIDADVRVGADGMPVVIEMSPRIGGNGIPALIAHATGFDLHRFAIELALGQEPAPFPAPGRERPAAVHVLGALVDGTVQRLPMSSELRERVPGLLQLDFDCAVGETVRRFSRSSDQIGRALTEGGDPAEIGALLDQVFSEGVVP